MERLVRAWMKLDRAEEHRQERMNHRCRRVSIVPDDEGMYVVRGRLTPEVTEGARGRILDAGRRTRTVPGAICRALEARDRGCRFPGFGLRFTEAHHIVHWADGGETKLSNAVLLCGRHHRRVHEGGVRVCADKTGAQIVFFTPEGRAMPAAPPMPALESDGLESLIDGNRGRSVAPYGLTGAPRYRDDRFIPWAMEARAWEALDRSDEPEPVSAGIEATVIETADERRRGVRRRHAAEDCEVYRGV